MFSFKINSLKELSWLATKMYYRKVLRGHNPFTIRRKRKEKETGKIKKTTQNPTTIQNPLQQKQKVPKNLAQLKNVLFLHPTWNSLVSSSLAKTTLVVIFGCFSLNCLLNWLIK